MTSKYTQAVIELLINGMPVDAVLSGLKTSLKKNHHAKLYVKVLAEVSHMFARRAGKNMSVVTLAKETDEKLFAEQIQAALDTLGVKEKPYDVIVDETIIGGHIVATKDKRVDQSYKHALLQLYRSVVERT